MAFGNRKMSHLHGDVGPFFVLKIFFDCWSLLDGPRRRGHDVPVLLFPRNVVAPRTSGSRRRVVVSVPVDSYTGCFRLHLGSEGLSEVFVVPSLCHVGRVQAGPILDGRQRARPRGEAEQGQSGLGKTVERRPMEQAGKLVF